MVAMAANGMFMGRTESPIVRMHWYPGGDKAELDALIRDVVRNARRIGVESYEGAALVPVVFLALSDAFEAGAEDYRDRITCDIEEHGLYEFEIVLPNYWKLNHYNICWGCSDELSEPVTICDIHFAKDSKKLNIEWHFDVEETVYVNDDVEDEEFDDFTPGERAFINSNDRFSGRPLRYPEPEIKTKGYRDPSHYWCPECVKAGKVWE